MGVIESNLDIYLTNSACVGLPVLGFRPERSTWNDLFYYRYKIIETGFQVEIIIGTVVLNTNLSVVIGLTGFNIINS